MELAPKFRPAGQTGTNKISVKENTRRQSAPKFLLLLARRHSQKVEALQVCQTNNKFARMIGIRQDGRGGCRGLGFSYGFHRIA